MDHKKVFYSAPIVTGNEHTPLREEYVYLHPDVMTACGFVINHLVWLIIPLESSSVELKGDSEMYIAVKTWPLTKMGENGNYY